jgi:hypothetical protein
MGVMGKMISPDAGKQLTTRGDSRKHPIFTCGQEIVLDRDGNILYVRNLSKEQLNELFQRRPGFRDKATC